MANCHLVAYREAGFNVVAIASGTYANAQKVAARHQIETVYEHSEELLSDKRIEVVDVAVPPDVQFEVIQQIVKQADHIRGILAQKPLGSDYQQACEIVRMCRDAGIALAVNQNMRYDQSVRACKVLLDEGALGTPVLATIDMRAVPHWMPWQGRQGWLTLRILSIHHLDTFRYWFGNPVRVFTSVRSDPRTAAQFAHEDGICLSILEYTDGLRAASWDDVWTGPNLENAEPDHRIGWRVEGTDGLAKGTIGWPKYPKREPSTIDYCSQSSAGWERPRWDAVWFPDAFAGPLAELLCALEENREPAHSGQDNLQTMALVDACYRSAQAHRAVELAEIIDA